MKHHVRQWFSSGLKNSSRVKRIFSDDVQIGQSRSAVTSKCIDAMRKLISSDYHLMYDDIEISLNISRTHVHLNLHNHLKEKKVRSDGSPTIYLKLKKMLKGNGARKINKFNSSTFKIYVWHCNVWWKIDLLFWTRNKAIIDWFRYF